MRGGRHESNIKKISGTHVVSVPGFLAFQALPNHINDIKKDKTYYTFMPKNETKIILRVLDSDSNPQW